MSAERNYTGLNLDQDCIIPITNAFCEEHSLTIRSLGDRPGGSGKRIIIGGVGIDNAILDVYLNQDGTSTLQWKLGKNQEISRSLADALYETINPDEFQSVNMSIKGVDRDSIQAIIALLPEDDTKTFIVQESQNSTGSIQWKIQCHEHGDSLTVTHHTTLKLQIQGKPLSCYRKLVYLLAETLDLAGLERVLSRTEENLSVIVRKEVAADYLKKMMPNSYDNLPGLTRDLLVSGQCVKLASPALSEYSMLLFPELRSLEGVLKWKLASFGFDSDVHDFGYFFAFANGAYELRSSFHGHITDATLRSHLGNAYTFFHKHRHGLFHMESLTEASRKIGTISQLLTLSETAYNHLDNLYS
ncbi:type II toxin-antitoxin system RnlA family toxin [Serratia marcescens]|uniref:type II toxin-antitoxin system RnlA family toxin n=1 Tax=Serratia TaxID=613 RepID=UPI000D3E7207|nr:MULTISPECIES: type II toxin-antitoxin system RnlA family toxin [Serratia]AWC81881.1 mRNA endoribonuclease LS [Serratia marcescens]